MKIRKDVGAKKGIHGEDVGDEKIFVETDGEEALTDEDLFTYVKYKYENEERLRPDPYLGSRYFMLALIDLRYCPIDEVLRTYKLRTKRVSDTLEKRRKGGRSNLLDDYDNTIKSNNSSLSSFF